MIIANPIFDTYFRRLMENERTVKFFIGTLLECEVLSVDLRPQELTFFNARGDEPERRWANFVATLRADSGGTQKMFINVKHAPSYSCMDICNGHYRLSESSNEEPVPVTFIYLLGFDLPEIASPYFKKIGDEYTDMLTHKPIKEYGRLLRGMTHDTYVIQTARLTENHSTDKLHELLGLFEHRQFADEEKTIKLYAYEPTHEEVREMSKMLSDVMVDPEVRKQLRGELEYYRMRRSDFYGILADLEEERRAKAEKILEEKGKDIEENIKEFEEEIAFTAAFVARFMALERTPTFE